jgi:hypothetical protein
VSLPGQDGRGHEAEAIGGSGDEHPGHDGSFLAGRLGMQVPPSGVH